MIKWEIENLLAEIEREKLRAMDPSLFSAVAEKLTEYVTAKIAEAKKK